MSWRRSGSSARTRSLERADDRDAAGGPAEEVLEQLARGRAALARARSLATVAREELAGVIDARAAARTAGGPSLGEPYDEVEESFLELTRSIEKDDVDRATRAAPSVESRFRSIELAAIKRNTLERIDDLIAKARREEAETYVPQCAERHADAPARLSRSSSRAIATPPPRSRSGQPACSSTPPASRISPRAREPLQPEAPSRPRWRSKAMLHEVGEALALEDRRNLSAGGQVRALSTSAVQLRRDLETAVAEIAAQRSRIAELQGENQSERERIALLEKEQEFQSRFARVSGFFTPDEAEVYKKGANPRAATAEPRVSGGRNGGAARKLSAGWRRCAERVGAFEGADVVIEGHTDSSGSTTANDRISQERADAVRAYLVASGTIPSTRIVAVGKGFSEPIASDRTAEGRAQNRRIDVVIEPVPLDATVPRPSAGE